jgi:hypothetical protein
MPLPNFLLIGATKCGTTALYETLKEHPQVFMSPVKEPYFFNFEGHPPAFSGPEPQAFQSAIRDWETYARLFDGADGKAAIGEATATYLSAYHPDRTAENILRHLPSVRLVAILRQPARRAYSHYCDKRGNGFEPLGSFREAIAAEDGRVAANWPIGYAYRRNGLYCANLKPFYERFAADRIRVSLYEDWRDRPSETLGGILEFLGIDRLRLTGAGARHNVTRFKWSPALHRWLAWPNRSKDRLKPLLPPSWRGLLKRMVLAWNSSPPPPLDPEFSRELTEGYRSDILDLQELIGRDLSHWLAA